ncbi:MAG: CPBP family intramembrane metalloprotease [Anaerolineae bacterium]|nr:CPBP family intramembrane metalloprotease [Anaerolineae bacterium]
MKIKEWALSNTGVIGISIGLTVIVLIESIFPPWAPYFILYALLALALPLVLRSYEFGSFGTVLKSNWRLVLAVFAIVLIWDEGITTWLYERVLDSFGLGGNPYYSLNAAIGMLADAAAQKFNIAADEALMFYALFVLVWAPIGEELFYRGYVQGTLRQNHRFSTAALISAAFFGIRHATHLFFLWPNVPLVAAASWVLGTFVFGLLMSYLYEKTHSLYPPILIHFVGNLIEVILSL